MKQTIISKCFSKVKRVALTLFAALCVGSVWAEEGETTTPEATPESGSTSSTSKLTIDERYGYVRTGLGELGDQAIVVFTNSSKDVTCTWTPPKGLKNVEFLAVGGGGGGGGHYKGSQTKYYQGGAGGGGGAVVTGFICNLAADQDVTVTVGAGGTNGWYTTSNATGSGAGGNGGNSIIKVGNLTYITAFGGGGDGGYNSTGGKNGGSNSGARANKTAANLKTVTVIGEGAEEFVSDVVSRAHKGGGGYTTTSGYPGAGGGGAGGPGGQAGAGESSSWGGACGYGYVSMITDERVVYGAGGGGGLGKNGGHRSYGWDEDEPFIEGAGRGTAGQDGGDALPNQGGGGGGGSYMKNGGEGGSGVVIFRFPYSEADIRINVTDKILPKILDKVYTGEVLSSGLVDTFAYKVKELNECVNVGAKVVRVTLNEGYVWDDGTTERYKDFTWNILKQENNVWVTAPYIHVDSWPQAFANSVVFNRAVPLAGELVATIAKDKGANQLFKGNLPTEPGTYKLIYKVEDTSNHSPLYWEKTFTIYPSEAIEGGYKVSGLGAKQDEVAVVFTSSANWTVPANLKSAQFLVVGGGGGGGADTLASGEQISAGSGGGGGGVVTGIANFSKNDILTIKVGRGGSGATAGSALNQKYGAAPNNAEDSSFELGSKVRAVAFAGGVGGGDPNQTAVPGGSGSAQAGLPGGSSSGSRSPKTASKDVANPLKGTVDYNANDGVIITYDPYGEKGGAGASSYQAGGGGGARQSGFPGSDNSGGNGGEGLRSDITGAQLVYGSGGGGGGITAYGGLGGTGAGNGGRWDAATAALPNQGGGGGGGGRNGNGGNGGSGIVVFRYSVYQAEVTTTEGSTSYATFADAFAAAEAGATVKLLNDVTLAEKITVKKAVTLDLNGCKLSETVTDSYGAIYVGTAGNLTITDSATGGKIATDGGIVIGNYGTVTVAGGTIEAGAVAEEDASVYNFYYNGSTYGKLTVNGGKVGRIWNCGNANITAGEVVDIDNSGAMTIADAVTVSGSVVIKDGSDAADVPGAGTLTAPESLTVQVGNEGAEAFYVDGKWLVQVAVATIGEAKFASLDAAIAAAGADATITLIENIELTAFVSIAKSFTLDLNGKSINRANGTALYVNGDVNVTIQGEGSVSGNQAVYVNAGTVVIKGGNFHGYNGGHAVYVQGTGKVEILDGTFSIDPSGSYDYVLNKYDADRKTTSIVVKGGKFKGFNPANNGAEGAGTNFCADGYAAELNSEGYYVVAKLAIAPNGTTEVTASSPDDAASKVTILVPDAMKDVVTADKYAEYFVKSAVYNESTGKYTVTAALNPDVVKPVIAKTTPVITFKDGTVTVNIENELPGLYYGVRYATTVEAVETTAPVEGFTVTPKVGDTAGFFKVVVDFKEIQ